MIFIQIEASTKNRIAFCSLIFNWIAEIHHDVRDYTFDFSYRSSAFVVDVIVLSVSLLP